MVTQPYNNKELSFLKSGYKKMTIKELTIAYNKKFDHKRTENAIKGVLFRKGFKSGRTGCFKSCQEPWNKGKKGYMSSNKTSFKPGNLPHNHKPLYSEREGKDGYIEISVPEKNPQTGFFSRYKMKHVWIWEKDNGPVPSGYVVSFRDGDKKNIYIDNLTILSRAELLWLNRNGYSNVYGKESRAAMRSTARLACRVNELRRNSIGANNGLENSKTT